MKDKGYSMDDSPRALAAQISTFFQELIGKGFSQSMATELAYRYADHLFNVAALQAQSNAAQDSTGSVESAPADQ